MTINKATLDLIEKYLMEDKISEAEDLILPLIEENPESFDAWHKLGSLKMKMSCWEEALQALVNAQTISPASEPVWFALAFCLNQKGDTEKSVSSLRQLLAINPRHTQAMMAAGEICYRSSKFWDAYQFYEKYLHIFPHKKQEMLPRLIICLQYAAIERVDDYNVKLELHKRFKEIGLEESATQAMIEAINCDPEKWLSFYPNSKMALMTLIAQNMSVCNWEHWDDNLELLRSYKSTFCEPSMFNLVGTTQEEQYENTKAYTDWRYPDRVPMCKTAPIDYKNRKINIGYISSDLHEHATSYLITGLFESHDKEKFNVHIYSFGIDDKSPIRERIKNAAYKFTDLWNKSPSESYNEIKTDNLDILVDLKGYCTGHCMDIISKRPAPVLVHYLGFPSTTGGLCDYIIADDIVIPEENRKYFSEKVVYIEPSYQINDDSEIITQKWTIADYGLREDSTVYACFNQPYKITPSVFHAWLENLKQDPAAVLWILEMYPEQIENLRYQAKKANINPERIISMPFRNRHDHLDRIRFADYVLETSPVGGHTTLQDCIKMGVENFIFPPAIHNTFISNVSASLLKSPKVTTKEKTRQIEEAYERIIFDYNNS